MVGAMMAVMPYSANASPRFCGWESIGENGLRHRLEPAAAGALQYAKQNQACQGWRGAAQQRAESENENAEQEETLPAEQASPAIR